MLPNFCTIQSTESPSPVLGESVATGENSGILFISNRLNAPFLFPLPIEAIFITDVFGNNSYYFFYPPLSKLSLVTTSYFIRENSNLNNNKEYLYILFVMFCVAATFVAGATKMQRIIPIAEARADINGDYIPDLLGDTVTVAGRVTVETGILHQERLQIYIQDGSAGINLFARQMGIPVKQGDSLIATGTIIQYYGLTELYNPKYKVVRTKRYVPEPIDLENINRPLERYEGMLVRGKGNVINKGRNQGGQYILLNISDNIITAFVSTFHFPDLDLTTYEPGDQIRITGILGQHDFSEPYKGDYQIYVRYPQDIETIGFSRAWFRKALITTGIFFFGGIIWMVFLAVDVRKRKKAEKDLLKQRALLNGTNKVFRETLLCDTSEAVAHTCLSVAKELTGSLFGWIGGVDKTGHLRTITSIEPTQKDCVISRSDINTIVKGMEIRGIWNRIIKDVQPLIIDYSSSQDTIETPPGCPPLCSFLGVPLKNVNGIIGIIALFNKESGFGPDDQEDMEILSIAFVEALERKRAEETAGEYFKDLERWKKITVDRELKMLELKMEIRRLKARLDGIENNTEYDG